MQQSVKERLCILYQHTTDTGTAPCPRVIHTLTVAQGSTHTYRKARGKETKRDSQRERTGTNSTVTETDTDRQTKRKKEIKKKVSE